MTKTTIVVADDHQVVRHGLKALLDAESDFQVIGEACDGIEAVDMVERLCPGILVLDMVMPGINGIISTNDIRDIRQTI